MPQTGEIDLQRYIQQERKRLDQFERYWESRHKHEPKNFPSSLMPGDWDEQYSAWCAVTNPKESTT
jgi:hypothetical protein